MKAIKALNGVKGLSGFRYILANQYELKLRAIEAVKVGIKNQEGRNYDKENHLSKFISKFVKNNIILDDYKQNPYSIFKLLWQLKGHESNLTSKVHKIANSVLSDKQLSNKESIKILSYLSLTIKKLDINKVIANKIIYDLNLAISIKFAQLPVVLKRGEGYKWLHDYKYILLTNTPKYFNENLIFNMFTGAKVKAVKKINELNIDKHKQKFLANIDVTIPHLFYRDMLMLKDKKIDVNLSIDISNEQIEIENNIRNIILVTSKTDKLIIKLEILKTVPSDQLSIHNNFAYVYLNCEEKKFIFSSSFERIK